MERELETRMPFNFMIGCMTSSQPRLDENQLKRRLIAALQHILAQAAFIASLFILLALAYFFIEGAPMSVMFGVFGGTALLIRRVIRKRKHTLDTTTSPKAWSLLHLAFLKNLASAMVVIAIAAFLVASFQLLINEMANPNGWRIRLDEIDKFLLQTSVFLDKFSQSPVLWWLSVAALCGVILKPDRLLSGFVLIIIRWSGRVALSITALALVIYSGQQTLENWKRALVTETNKDVRIVTQSFNKEIERSAALVLFHEKIKSTTEQEAKTLETLIRDAGQYARPYYIRREVAQRAVSGAPIIGFAESSSSSIANEDIPSNATIVRIERRIDQAVKIRAKATALKKANDAYQEVVSSALSLLLPDIESRELKTLVNTIQTSIAELAVKKLPISENTSLSLIRENVQNWLQSNSPNWELRWKWNSIGLTGVAEGNGLSSATVLSLMSKRMEKQRVASRAAGEAAKRARPWWKKIKIRF